MTGVEKLHAQFEEIIKDIYEGNSVANILRKRGISNKAFFETIAEVPSLEERYTRALIARSELLVDEIVEIADTSRDAQTARNQIDARKWYASKMQPQKYGERIDLNINQTVDIRGALEAAQNRIRDVIQIPKIQLTETTSEIPILTTGLKPAVVENPTKNELDELLD